MKKTGIIIKREYLRRVNKKSFFLITILTPFLFAALVFVPLLLSSVKDDKVREVMIIDRTEKYAPLFKDTDNFKFVNSDDKASLEALKGNSSGIFAFLEISDDLLNNPRAVSLYSEKQIPQDLKKEVNRTLSRYLEDEKRKSFNIPNLDEIIAKSHVNIDVQTIKWGKDGEAKKTSAELGGIIGMVFTLIIYMFLLMYGAMVMQGVMEEKTNRIVEVMVSSVRPFELMMGKIIGIGLVGITQVIIWCILTTILVSAGGIFFGLKAASMQPDMAMLQQGMPEMQNMTADILTKLGSFNFVEIIFYFILFFIGGYISYASLFAAIGSAIDNPEDSQQFMTPMMMLLVFALYAGIYSMNNPDGPLAFWCSLIPFTSPIVMMIRIPYDIPFWQILLSLVLLYASAVALVWVTAKIYRVGILMYGKKPSLKEIVKWIKY
ncbi:MAG: ABC transporter permease [Tannerella sp.]|jgi:ABC-2 type transport system permease protein|nr:ABC transporter permease [Tannerella sp.]